MEKNDMETHDFMNVESFSQLPFIRPSTVLEKSIRLFGKEFGGSNSGGTITSATEESVSRDGSPSEENRVKEDENDDSTRKFECHYCCRNFPTSQALGGHQNAHKRERQQAKRAHIQSAASVTHNNYYNTAYHRIGAAPLPSYQHSWNNNIDSVSSYATTDPRFYTNTHHPTITGSPLGLWRFPSVQNHGMVNRERSLFHHQSSPIFGNDEQKHKTSVGGETSSSPTPFAHEGNSSIQDQVSLDLHL